VGKPRGPSRYGPYARVEGFVIQSFLASGLSPSRGSRVLDRRHIQNVGVGIDTGTIPRRGYGPHSLDRSFVPLDLAHSRMEA
jgi:hypothetical protein